MRTAAACRLLRRYWRQSKEHCALAAAGEQLFKVLHDRVAPPEHRPDLRSCQRAFHRLGHRLLGELLQFVEQGALDPDQLFGLRSEEHTSELQSPCNLV